jgi:hypothetical protein
MESKQHSPVMLKQIKQSTLDGYNQRLKKLNDGKEIDSYSFLYDPNVIMDKIKAYKPSTQRNYIIAIVQAIKQIPGPKDGPPRGPELKNLFEIYSKIMDEFNTSLKKNNTKSVQQQENWCTQEAIEGVYKKLLDEYVEYFVRKNKSFTETEWDKILEVVILGLYTLQPPRRILDYTAMYIVKKMPKEIDQSVNYYDLSTDMFHYNTYKTSGTYKTQSFKAPEKLATLLDCYVKVHPNKLTSSNKIPLLCKLDGSVFEKSYAITRILNRIFKRELGKRVSVNLLRNIYLTSKFGPKVAELSNTASQMGTSSSTISDNYIKID